MKLLVVCLMTHYALANLLPAPWWLPDLTLAGLAVAIAEAPQRWLAFALVAASSTVLWTIRDTGLTFSGLLAAGWVLCLCAGQWDLTDQRVLRLSASAVTAGLPGLVLWAHGWWSWPLALMWLVHAALTGVSAGLIGRFAAAPRASSSVP